MKVPKKTKNILVNKMIRGFHDVEIFENKIADFYNAPYAIAVDCCTHAIELCLRYKKVKHYTVPKKTYISVPFLAEKLNISFDWKDEEWQNYYYLGGTNIIDAAVFWKQDGYIQNTFMCVSFQYKKHLNLLRGGIILTDDKNSAIILKRMSYDGRSPYEPWAKQDIEIMGYHYYMTPETAKLGLDKLEEAIKNQPKKWSSNDYPDLTKMSVFRKNK